MPSSLTAAMEAELKQNIGSCYPVVELTLGGTVYRFAERPVVSASEGLYLPYIPDGGLGQRTRSANVSEFSLEMPALRFKIFDHDRVLQKLFGGPLRGSVRNSSVEVWWRSPNVPAASHYLDFSGRITNYGVEDRMFDFQAQADISALDAQVKIKRWSKEHWPYMPDEYDGTPNRVIYGRHSSIGVAGSAGMIQCVPVVQSASSDKIIVWGIGLCGVSAVPRVYFDGVANSDFQYGVSVRGDQLYSVLYYGGGAPFPTKDSDVRCDVDGLATFPYGTGTLITNPAEQIRHLLNVFVYGTGAGNPLGAWPSETGKPIAGAIFDRAEDFFRYRNWEGAMVIESGSTGKAAFNQWCSSFNAAPFFSDTWGIGAMPRDDGEKTIYYDDRHAAQKLGHARELKLSTIRIDPVSDLQVNYLVDDSRGAYTRSQLVAWRRTGQLVVERTFDMPYGRRSV